MRLVTTIIIAMLIGSPAQSAETRRAQYLMGTVCEIAVHESTEAEPQIDAAYAEAERIESLISTWRDSSELSRLNRGEITTVSPELARLLSETLAWTKDTGGAFSPLVGPMIALWKTRDAGRLPDAASIATARATSDAGNVLRSGRRFSLRNGAAFEEGGFGKGYALDRMIALLRAPAMIDFGGQVVVSGWQTVAIADPARRDHAVLELDLQDESVSTSSGSEKTFVADGRTFSHIFDPRTGEALPPRGSVSVISVSAMTADVLSTALYVMGVEDGLRWADEHGIQAIFMTPDQTIRVSSAVLEQKREVRLIDPEFKIKD